MHNSLNLCISQTSSTRQSETVEIRKWQWFDNSDKKQKVPVFYMFKPAKVVGNEVEILTARTAYNHDSRVIRDLRKCLWWTSPAYFACEHNTVPTHRGRICNFFWYVTYNSFITITFTVAYSAKKTTTTR